MLEKPSTMPCSCPAPALCGKSASGGGNRGHQEAVAATGTHLVALHQLVLSVSILLVFSKILKMKVQIVHFSPFFLLLALLRYGGK